MVSFRRLASARYPRRVRGAPALVLVCCGLCGCFVEAAGGGYVLSGDQSAHAGWGFGLAAGFYIDPGPVRVAIGGGGDAVLADSDAGEAAHVGGGGFARLDVTLATIGPYDHPDAFRFHLTGTFGGPGRTMLRVADVDGEESLEPADGRAYSTFLGATIGGYFGNLSLHFSLGPSLVTSDTDELGRVVAIGPQARATFSFVLGGMGALFRHGYTPWDRDADRDVRDNERYQQDLEQRYQDQQQQYREQQERERQMRCGGQPGCY